MVDLDVELWLKPEDVEPESTLVILDEGKHGEIPKGDDQESVKTFELGVQIPSGGKRSWTMNATSQRAIAQTYGLDTKAWIGKNVIVFVQQQNVGGTMKKVIYARVPLI